VVLPLRRGYGEGGPWPENPGTCENPDFVRAGNAAADDIEAVVRYLRRQPTVQRDRILLVGQSAGGFGAIATAARNPDGVFGVVNIAGGRCAGEGDGKCAPDRLVEANALFGKTAKVPSLWLYTENDSYFDLDISRRMVSAYGGAGGRAVYVLLPPFKDDGHKMFDDRDGLPLWTPQVAAFLDALE
jgi:dienelactone hydrolase